MAPRRERRGSSTETKNTIAKAAAAEFIANGYAGTSLSRVADRMSLTKGALVYHFPAKADFANYFVQMVHAATSQADEFSKHQYPQDGAKRLLLHFVVMGTWWRSLPEVAAGIALFGDASSPAFESDQVVQAWLDLSVDAFVTCEAHGQLTPGLSPLEAAEMLLASSLGSLLFRDYVRLNAPDTKAVRFIRLALTSVGIPNVDESAEEVLREYRDRIPRFDPES